MKTDDIVLAVIDALNAECIPYLLVGSFSSNYYGIPRSTLDADFVIEISEKSVTCLRPHLGADFTLDPQTAFETITGTIKNVIKVKSTDFEVELFRLSRDAHDQERFQRRRCVKLLGRDVYLPTAEDVIITKLRWLRRKDYDDVTNVIAVQGTRLDWEYVQNWCDEHGTRETLEEIRASIPPIDGDERVQ